MADKSRTINTKFWDDQFVQELTPTNKLLFLYLLTNPLTNLMGVYEISVKRIIFDTGLNSEIISKGFECFANHKKIVYEDGFIFISNFLKNQNLNSNMKKGVENLFDNLPKDIQDKILCNGLKGFESISNGLLKLKGKEKEEKEIERECETEKIDFETFWNLYDKKVGEKQKIKNTWYKLTKEIQLIILDHIPKYKISQPDKAFRKDPERYFSNKFWESELIFKGEQPQQQQPIDLVKGVMIKCDYGKEYRLQQSNKGYLYLPSVACPPSSLGFKSIVTDDNGLVWVLEGVK